AIEETCHVFRDRGYVCQAISALTGEGIDELKELLREKAL
ncbi:MAG: GTPase ObgE, partial [Deltaproteobacteria bacterium]|nr:GTPase ObgE [Deltaproteobacteria bacterium]